MGRDFSVIKANVGGDVQDTSTTFASLIGRYINRRYMEILRRINWNYINEDYSFNTVAGTQDYAMESDFKTPVYVYDSTNDLKLKKVDLQDLFEDKASTLESQGTVSAYTIFKSDDGSTYMRLYMIPTSVITIKAPYVVKPTELSADTDEPILGLEDLIEIGATADAWRYKRQFAKATVMDTLFEKKLLDYIWEQENQQDQTHMFIPKPYSRETV